MSLVFHISTNPEDLTIEGGRRILLSFIERTNDEIRKKNKRIRELKLENGCLRSKLFEIRRNKSGRTASERLVCEIKREKPHSSWTPPLLNSHRKTTKLIASFFNRDRKSEAKSGIIAGIKERNRKLEKRINVRREKFIEELRTGRSPAIQPPR